MRNKKREKLKKYLYNNYNQLHKSSSKIKMQNGNQVSITTTPDYNYHRIVDPQKKQYKNELSEQVKSLRQTHESTNRIEKAEDIRVRKTYENKMNSFEKTQLLNREKIKKALRDDLNWQIKEKLGRSTFY